jgi:AcrR family transcriptional regulator
LGQPEPARADARRNREKLVTVAKAAFAASGGAVPLEAIARQAGVGIGTLYRHFPTREALVEAVYAAELEDVVASGTELAGKLPPDAALRAWMHRYAQFWETKHAIMGTLRAGFASGRIAPPTWEGVTKAITPILARGAEEGIFRPDIDPDDVVALLLGAFLATSANDRQHQVPSLFDLIVNAIRVPNPAVPPSPPPSGG